MDYASANLFLDLAQERLVHQPGLSQETMREEGYAAIPMNWDDKMLRWAVSGQINDANLTFLLDTGSSVTCVDRPLAYRISFSGPETEVGLTGETHREGAKASRVRVTELRLGDFPTETTHVYITPPGEHNTPGFLIGADVLARHSAVLDFGESMLYLKRANMKRKTR